MHKMLTALLLGATMATPVLAQDRGRDDDRRPPVDGRRDGAWADRDQTRAPDRDAGRADPRVPDGRDRRYDAGRLDDRRDGRLDGRVAGRDDRFDGRDARDDRTDGRRDWRGDGRARYDDRFANNRGDQRWNGGAGSWNRDWRADRRYDWQSYRRGNDRAFRAPRYYGPRGVDYGYRRWSPGYRIAPAYYGQGYWIARPDQYRLPPAYGGYRWVRYYDDVALVDIRSGLIADILYSFFL
ncbi:MAG TPA: RcnB family protein [Sphingomonas sp.]|jgi:Ni/Co efflux regulator RcnB|uniref:RcnB family protein n=1 Tax=Sphingomonas sp. TaxID=28214 RepID=UPI002EDA1D8C